jgi:hypothetical protein
VTVSECGDETAIPPDSQVPSFDGPTVIESYSQLSWPACPRTKAYSLFHEPYTAFSRLRSPKRI